MIFRPTARRSSVVLTGVILTTLSLTAGSVPASPPGAGSAGGGDSYYPRDGNGGYHVTDYDVAIRYDPENKHLNGDTTVSAQATQTLKRFDLDLAGLTVHSVQVDRQPAAFSRTGKHELVITPKQVMPKGHHFAVEVRYSGRPAEVEKGNGWQTSPSGGAFALGEPHAATSWFPANGIPRDKATFHLSAKVPNEWGVISIGREGKPTRSNGWTTHRWSEETPTTTYLTTIGIDKYTFHRSKLPDGTPIVDAYGPGTSKQQRANTRKLPEVLSFLESKFGPYPQDAAGSILGNTPIGYSLETQSRPSYGKGAADMETIVHENAHQWWGDSVSVDRWRDTCNNECFASYATWMWDAAKNAVNLDKRYRKTVAKEEDDKEFWAQKLYDMGAGNEFSGVYSKGPLALHALRHYIGEDAFAQVLKGWPSEHRNGNATFGQLESYVERVSGRNLSGFFTAWFRGSRIPPKKYLWPVPPHPSGER